MISLYLEVFSYWYDSSPGHGRNWQVLQHSPGRDLEQRMARAAEFLILHSEHLQKVITHLSLSGRFLCSYSFGLCFDHARNWNRQLPKLQLLRSLILSLLLFGRGVLHGLKLERVILGSGGSRST